MSKSIIGRSKSEKHITFEYNTGDNDEDIPINVTHVRVLPGVTKIEESAFCNRSRLESITLPSTVVEIGEEAFFNCSNLREVNFHNNGLKKIRDRAFYDCKSLESITLPSTLLEIGKYAFAACNNLRTILFNEGLKKVDFYGFACCTSLQSITLPSTLTTIGSYAFTGCVRIREVVILNERSQDHGIIFKQVMLAISVRKLNFPGLSTRLENISKVDYWSDVIEDKIDSIPQIVRRENSSGFLISTRERGEMVDWKLVKQSFDEMYTLISYYELKEATSLFELALWKVKIDQVDDVVEITSRDAYRIEVPGPVKDTILQYL